MQLPKLAAVVQLLKPQLHSYRLRLRCQDQSLRRSKLRHLLLYQKASTWVQSVPWLRPWVWPLQFPSSRQHLRCLASNQLRQRNTQHRWIRYNSCWPACHLMLLQQKPLPPLSPTQPFLL